MDFDKKIQSLKELVATDFDKLIAELENCINYKSIIFNDFVEIRNRYKNSVINDIPNENNKDSIEIIKKAIVNLINKFDENSMFFYNNNYFRETYKYVKNIYVDNEPEVIEKLFPVELVEFSQNEHTYATKSNVELSGGLILVSDINDFGIINQQRGHKIGNEILFFLPEIIKEYFSLNQIDGGSLQLGYDEFITYFKLTDNNAIDAIDQLNDHISNYDWDFVDKNLKISTTTGFVEKIKHEGEESTIVRALIGLVKAKKFGKGTILKGPTCLPANETTRLFSCEYFKNYFSNTNSFIILGERSIEYDYKNNRTEGIVKRAYEARDLIRNY